MSAIDAIVSRMYKNRAKRARLMATTTAIEQYQLLLSARAANYEALAEDLGMQEPHVRDNTTFAESAGWAATCRARKNEFEATQKAYDDLFADLDQEMSQLEADLIMEERRLAPDAMIVISFGVGVDPLADASPFN